MSHLTQIRLEDAQYERLLAEARASGVRLAELIRRAVDRTYGQAEAGEFTKALEESFGAWARDDLDGERYVESIRPARSDRFTEW